MSTGEKVLISLTAFFNRLATLTSSEAKSLPFLIGL
jgi:hypothetical protein